MSPRPKKPPEDKKRRNFTIWADEGQAERIEHAIEVAATRAGFPLSNNAWLLSVVMRAVEEEEKKGKAR